MSLYYDFVLRSDEETNIYLVTFVSYFWAIPHISVLKHHKNQVTQGYTCSNP
jgi:hypothetical protein